ncbi:MAG TPA: hypothetical protein VFB19_08470 [Mycobacterium sp.]|nr:hypothetical protein [Mycobacterium sp.]
MHADTTAIRAYGATTADLAADLHAAAALLRQDMTAAFAAALGPAGARFAAALTEATAGLATSVAAIGENMITSAHTTHAAAAGYEDVEERSRVQITGVGM